MQIRLRLVTGSVRGAAPWVLFLVSALATCATTQAAEEARWRSAFEAIRREHAQRHVEVLADDTFEGREAGSRGGRAASVYLGQEFQKLKLGGAGTAGGYYQAFGNNYRNILGRLEGSDPQLKNEYVLIGAHYDHVGYGTASNSYGPTGYIHNGADDNASGAAALLEVAKAFSLVDPPPRRTIIFALWDAEEKGLLGSKHWLASPTIPLKDLVLAVNMDMVGRVRNDKMEVIGTRTSHGLRRIVSEHNRGPDLLLDFTWEMADNSDHHPFYERGIPILMLHSGLHSDYHRPSDDVERVDSGGIERSARILFGAAYEVANQPTRTMFRSASRSEGLGDQRAREIAAPPAPGRLGIRWNDSSANGQGVQVASVDQGSPAELAGVRVGDQVVKFAGQDVISGEVLRGLVATADAKTTISIVRGGQSADLPITLRGNRARLGFAWRTDDAAPGSVIVTRVTPGSPAAKADLRVNDVIYRIGASDFATSDDFHKLASTLALPFEIVVERKGKIDTRNIEPWLPAPAQEVETGKPMVGQ